MGLLWGGIWHQCIATGHRHDRQHDTKSLAGVTYCTTLLITPSPEKLLQQAYTNLGQVCLSFMVWKTTLLWPSASQIGCAHWCKCASCCWVKTLLLINRRGQRSFRSSSTVVSNETSVWTFFCHDTAGHNPAAPRPGQQGAKNAQGAKKSSFFPTYWWNIAFFHEITLLWKAIPFHWLRKQVLSLQA